MSKAINKHADNSFFSLPSLIIIISLITGLILGTLLAKELSKPKRSIQNLLKRNYSWNKIAILVYIIKIDNSIDQQEIKLLLNNIILTNKNDFKKVYQLIKLVNVNELDIYEICSSLKKNYSSKALKDILKLCIALSFVDKKFSEIESNAIKDMANYFQISPNDSFSQMLNDITHQNQSKKFL